MSARPFRLVPPVAPETDLQEKVAQALDLLLLPPAEWCAYPAGHIALTGQQAAKLARMGLRRGWPDLLVLYGSLFGIELKRPGGKLSRMRVVRSRRGSLRIVEGQAETFPKLEAAGMRIATCDTLAAVLVQLQTWGIPMRRAAL